jgi:hypothetical protein
MTKYTYNPEKLKFDVSKAIPSVYHFIISAIVLFAFAALFYSAYKTKEPVQYEKELIIFENDSSDTSFTFARFKHFVIDAGIRYPDIVIAQAVCESNFNSAIWKENNNPFGMKVAKSRNTTALGQNRNHAIYKTWQMAVIDYGYYQAVFMRKVKTRENYFKALSAYAEDPEYEQKLKRIIRKHKGFGISNDYLNDY